MQFKAGNRTFEIWVIDVTGDPFTRFALSVGTNRVEAKIEELKRELERENPIR